MESVTLDEALCGVKPTLMKFDIEGYEAFALQGGRQIIQNARPVLALCVYHHPFDLWELPLMVKSMVGDYRFFSARIKNSSAIRVTAFLSSGSIKSMFREPK